MDRKASASGVLLLLFVAALIATELARPQSPFEISGDATRGSRSGTRSGAPVVAQPTIVLERPPTCTDGLRNGVETDVDCGGAVCPQCAVNRVCQRDQDCQSRTCLSGVCTSPPPVPEPTPVIPTCTDGVKNAAETGVDCGGSTCPRCSNGAACLIASDCSSASCVNGVCQALPTCTDGAKNSQETDVDCGGPTCPKCAMDKMCASDTDCSTNKCYTGKCADAKVTLPCNRNQCEGTGVYLASGACSTVSPPTIYPVQRCNCNGFTNECTNVCSSGGCASGQTCQDYQCVTACTPQWRNEGPCTAPCGQTGNYQRQIDGCGNSRTVSCSGQACPKSGYCGWCGADSNCQSGFCYHGYCINRGDQVGGWGNPGVFQSCSEGSYCEAWSNKPIRLVQVQFTCNPSATPYSSTAEAVAFYKGNRVWSQTKECTNINVDPWRGVLPTYISWAPGSLGWVDKLVTYNQGTAIPTNAEVLPCVP